MIRCWQLIRSAPLLPPGNQGVELKGPTLSSLLVPGGRGKQPPTLLQSKSQLLNMKWGVVGRGLLRITRHPFTLMALKGFQELRTGDQML